MNKPTALAGLLSLALLAACSKPAPTGEGKDAAPASAAEPAAAKPKMGRAEYVSKILGTVDTAPQCQPFRDQLEQAANASADELLPAEMDRINAIAGEAYAAGCMRKP